MHALTMSSDGIDHKEMCENLKQGEKAIKGREMLFLLISRSLRRVAIFYWMVGFLIPSSNLWRYISFLVLQMRSLSPSRWNNLFRVLQSQVVWPQTSVLSYGPTLPPNMRYFPCIHTYMHSLSLFIIWGGVLLYVIWKKRL